MNFENPEAITGDPENFDQLSITFWGTKYFESTEGKQVRYGTNLRTDLYRQLKVSTEFLLDVFLLFAVYAVLVMVAVLFL